MGVSLTDLVTSQPTSFEGLKDRTIAIDAYNTLYQFLSSIRDRFTGEPLRNSKGNITSHLSGLFYRTSKLVEAGVTPVFVFDGTPPEFKKKTIEARIQVRQAAEVKWKDALKKGDAEAVRKYAQGAIRLTPEMVDEAKQLLELMGIAWVQAPSEGEAQATHMLKQGQVWAVGSQDWDSLLFGADRMVRNLTISGKRKVAGRERYQDVQPELVEREQVLAKLGISQEQLILLGMLVGTDYNPGGIKGIGPKKALKLVAEQVTAEKVFAQVSWEAETSWEDVLEFFKNPPSEDVDIPSWRMQPEKLTDYLAKEHDFSQDRVTSMIKRLQGAKKSQEQKGLGGFFGK